MEGENLLAEDRQKKLQRPDKKLKRAGERHERKYIRKKTDPIIIDEIGIEGDNTEDIYRMEECRQWLESVDSDIEQQRSWDDCKLVAITLAKIKKDFPEQDLSWNFSYLLSKVENTFVQVDEYYANDDIDADLQVDDAYTWYAKNYGQRLRMMQELIEIANSGSDQQLIFKPTRNSTEPSFFDILRQRTPLTSILMRAYELDYTANAELKIDKMASYFEKLNADSDHLCVETNIICWGDKLIKQKLANPSTDANYLPSILRYSSVVNAYRERLGIEVVKETPELEKQFVENAENLLSRIVVQGDRHDYRQFINLNKRYSEVFGHLPQYEIDKDEVQALIFNQVVWGNGESDGGEEIDLPIDISEKIKKNIKNNSNQIEELYSEVLMKIIFNSASADRDSWNRIRLDRHNLQEIFTDQFDIYDYNGFGVKNLSSEYQDKLGSLMSYLNSNYGEMNCADIISELNYLGINKKEINFAYAAYASLNDDSNPLANTIYWKNLADEFGTKFDVKPIQSGIFFNKAIGCFRALDDTKALVDDVNELFSILEITDRSCFHPQLSQFAKKVLIEMPFSDPENFCDGLGIRYSKNIQKEVYTGWIDRAVSGELGGGGLLDKLIEMGSDPELAKLWTDKSFGRVCGEVINRSRYLQLDKLNDLKEVTNCNLESLSSRDINSIYRKVFGSQDVTGFVKLYELLGVPPDMKDAQMRSCVNRYIKDLVYSAEFSHVDVEDVTAKFTKYIADVFKLSPEDYVDILKYAGGVDPKSLERIDKNFFPLLKSSVSENYMQIVHDTYYELLAVNDSITQKVLSLRVLSGVPPIWDQDRVKQIALRHVKNHDLTALASLAEIAGYKPDIEDPNFYEELLKELLRIGLYSGGYSGIFEQVRNLFPEGGLKVNMEDIEKMFLKKSTSSNFKNLYISLTNLKYANLVQIDSTDLVNILVSGRDRLDEIDYLEAAFASCRDFGVSYKLFPIDDQQRIMLQVVKSGIVDDLKTILQRDGVFEPSDYFIQSFALMLKQNARYVNLSSIEETYRVIGHYLPKFREVALVQMTNVTKDVFGKYTIDLVTANEWFTFLQNIGADSGEISTICSIYINKSLKDIRLEDLPLLVKILSLAGSEVDLSGYKKNLIDGFIENPKSIRSFFNKVDITHNFKDSPPEIQKKMYEMLDSPWMRTFRRLTEIQKSTSSAEHDPWVNELPYLFSSIKNSGIQIDHESKKQADAFVKFFEHFGMINLPSLFSIYFELGSQVSLESVSPQVKSMLAEIGIEINDQKGKPKMLAEIYSVMERYFTNFKSSLVRDVLPPKIASTVGLEYYQYLRGSSSFRASDYSTQDVLNIFASEYAMNPEKFNLPDYAYKAEYPITVSSSISGSKERDFARELNDLLVSSQVKELFKEPLANMVEAFSKNNDFDNLREQLDQNLIVKMHKIGQTLGIPPEAIDDLLSINTATNFDAVINRFSISDNHKNRSLLVSLKQAFEFKDILNDPLKWYTGKLDIQRNELLSSEASGQKLSQQETQRLENIHYLYSLLKEGGAGAMQVSMIEAMAEYKSQVKDDLLKKIIFKYFALNQPLLLSENLGRIHQEEAIEVEDIKYFSDVLRNSVLEHFLFSNPDAKVVHEHNQLIPLSEQATQMIAKAMGVVANRDGEIPINILISRISSLEDQAEQNRATVRVKFWPVAGIGRVMAPYSGDMCASKLDYQLARGDYEDLRAYLFTAGERVAKQRIVGSFFVIESESLRDGAHTLMIRGNNPRENFINGVDPESFVESVTTHMVGEVRRVWSRNETKRKVRLVVPMDSRGMSSTNRELIAKANVSVLGNNLSLDEIANTDTTNFNGYNVHNNYNGSGPRIVYEIDELGDEYWYGKKDFLGINSLSESFPEPDYTLEDLDSNSGREIAGVPVVQLQFRRLHENLDFKYVNKNDHVSATVDPANFVMFVDTVVKSDVDAVVLPVTAPHWRSVTTRNLLIEMSLGGSLEKYSNEPFFEVNTKGCGYTKPAAKGQNFAYYPSWTVNPNDSESKVYGIVSEWNEEDAKYYVDKSNELVSAGLRCEVHWVTVRPKALPYRGKMRTIEWLKARNVLPNDPDFFPIINIRALKTNDRIEEASMADDRRNELFHNAFQVFDKEMKYKHIESYGESDSRTIEEYFRHMTMVTARNLSILINMGNIHNALHASNISMAGEIMDIDTISPLEENDEKYQELYEGVERGYLKDMRDAINTVNVLFGAAIQAGISIPDRLKLKEDFVKKFAEVIDSETVSRRGRDAKNYVDWIDWIADQIIVKNKNLASLKDNSPQRWNRI